MIDTRYASEMSTYIDSNGSIRDHIGIRLLDGMGIKYCMLQIQAGGTEICF